MGTLTAAFRRHQLIGVERGQQACHVFDAERIGAEIFQLPGEVDVTIDVVDRAHRITERRFGMLAAGLHFTDRPVHIAHVVERVKDAKDVNPVGRRAFDESLEHVIGIGR